MKKSHVLGAVLTCVISLASFTTNAITVVDTGPGPTGNVGGDALNSSNWLAAKFITSSHYTIDSVEGWISQSFTNFFTVAIYTDSGTGEPASELYNAVFQGNGLEAAWVGASSLSWGLPAGSYWASFEARTGQLATAAMPNPASSPLGFGGAKSIDQGLNWIPTPGLDIGVRIQAVPIPPALWLFGSGLLGLVGVARRTNNE